MITINLRDQNESDVLNFVSLMGIETSDLYVSFCVWFFLLFIILNVFHWLYFTSTTTKVSVFAQQIEIYQKNIAIIQSLIELRIVQHVIE